jgi:hypothetical protein
MTQSVNVSPKTRNIHHTNRKKQILIVVGVLALIFIAWMIIRQNVILPRQEKARFDFAEQQVNLVVEQITANPQDLKEEKECFHPHGKFESSDISCRFTIKIPMSALRAGTDLQTVFGAFNTIPKFQQYPSNDSTYRGYILDGNKFSCSVSQWGAGQNTRIEILCNGGATKPIYPGL